MGKMKQFSPSSSLFVSVFVYALAEFHTAEALVKLPQNMTIPALFAFGDSIVDAGMNNNRSTVLRCDYLPYGIDFQGGKPTGRFTDGKIPTDIIAEELGIRDTLPAYLDPNLKPQDLATGVTFASGGAGYDSFTSRLVNVVPLQDQVEYFKEYIGRLKDVVGEEKAKFILSNAVFLVVAGSDDIANTYFTFPGRKQMYDINSYTDLMLSSASDIFTELYKLGARRIGVFSTPPVGCVPAQRTLGGIGRSCAENLNAAAQLFNTKLSTTIQSLAKQYSPDGKFVYIDVYNPLVDIMNYPNKYGFDVADKGCCGTGIIEIGPLCSQRTASVCSDISKHVFWDSYHPTETAYRALIKPLIQQYITEFV